MCQICIYIAIKTCSVSDRSDPLSVTQYSVVRSVYILLSNLSGSLTGPALHRFLTIFGFAKMEFANLVSKTPGQKVPSEIIDLDYPELDQIDCTPTTKNRLLSLRRKACQLLEQKSPEVTSSFLEWRLAVVSSKIEVRNTQREALAEVSEPWEIKGASRAAISAKFKAEQKSLLAEKTFLMSHRKILEEDLGDIVSNKLGLQEAYSNELRIILNATSSQSAKICDSKVARLERDSFGEIVNEYLDTRRVIPGEGEDAKFCNVLGSWLPSNQIKCADIVPRSWNTKDMAHTFGSDEPPLAGKRNGLSLQKKIEEGFDNCWIVVVPFDSVEPNPTEWKIVLLNTAEQDKVFFTDTFHVTD